MSTFRSSSLLLLAGPVALASCSDPGGPSADPPTTVTQVATGGFHTPTDAVASPDGRAFYFAARTDEGEPAVFTVASTPGSAASTLAAGEPFTQPMGLVLSCDGATLYVADLGDEAGPLFTLATSGGPPTALVATGVARASGLAMAPDCETLHVTGRTDDGRPALFAVARAGGAARVVFAGPPLIAPSGLHVDADGTAWVMDPLAAGPTGEGVLFAIPADGSAATVVVDDVRMGTPGGVSLTAGGGTAVIPGRDARGRGRLITVDIATGVRTEVDAPSMIEPAGLRTARDAAVFAVVDTEGNAIYRAD